MTDHYDQREAVYDAQPNCKGAWELGTACGKCPRCLASKPVAPAPARRQNLPAGPEWIDGVAAAAEDADRWLEFLQRGRMPSERDLLHLAACRTALRKMLEPG